MLESGTPAVLKIETIGSLGSAGVPESQNHELYYGPADWPRIGIGLTLDRWIGNG